MQVEERPLLRGRRILVVNADENVLSAAHNLLERFGCVVETAHNGGEALYMVRRLTKGEYDVVIADIRLPDMTGYEFLLKLQEIMDNGTAGADDGLRVGSRPFDRQGPAGRSANGALQAVPAGPVAQGHGANHPRPGGRWRRDRDLQDHPERSSGL